MSAPAVLQVVPDTCMCRVLTINTIEPIDGSDRIKLVTIRDSGWEVVVALSDCAPEEQAGGVGSDVACTDSSDLFRPGGKVIYWRIDSIPDPANCNTAKFGGLPLKTKKIRGVYSQGLVGRIGWVRDYGLDPDCLVDGDDLTQALLVTKGIDSGEEIQYKAHEIHLPFPADIPQTDLPRVQDDMRRVRKLIASGERMIGLRKEDGCSATYTLRAETTDELPPVITSSGEIVERKLEAAIVDGLAFVLCGRTWRWNKIDLGIRHYYDMAKKYDIDAKLRSLKVPIALQGEIVGPGINGNRLKLKELEFRVFKVWNKVNKYYYSREDVEALCTQLQLNIVPEVHDGALSHEWVDYKKILKFTDGLKYDSGSPAEGAVFSTNAGHLGPYVTFKVISNNYLTKHKC